MRRFFEFLKRPTRRAVQNQVRVVDRATMIKSKKLLESILGNELAPTNKVKRVVKVRGGGALVTVKLEEAPTVELMISPNGRVELYGGINPSYKLEYGELADRVRKIVQKRS